MFGFLFLLLAFLPPHLPAATVSSTGDMATASRIVVLVPGAGVTPANFATGLGGVARRSPVQWASWLSAEVGRSDVAVVAWLGYAPPSGSGVGGVVTAARPEAARAGARALVRYLGTLPPSARVTLVGHSYGSVVIGEAARLGGQGCGGRGSGAGSCGALPSTVTDVVALGSPGMGVASARDIPARVWAGRAAGDPIAWVPSGKIFGFGHGTDPMSAEFGAYRLPTAGTQGHDGYFVPGSGSLTALATVIRDSDAAIGARL
ncbi:alpha/beta hydrolase [Longispora albida]|uniref:alpha/beta hydrolase n=1 Tax=Longispora albida TaxID=203523 RepID=UPI00039F011B|nr:alpha/beta hydrolase [Longispora albida]